MTRVLIALAMAGLLVLGVSGVASAQADPTYPTRNGPKTTLQLLNELSAAGYTGPWEMPAMLDAYDRAAASTPAAQPRTPMGTSIEEACRHFAEDLSGITAAYGPGGNGRITIHEDSLYCPSVSSAVASSPSGNVVESQIDGEFMGWDGNTVFPLQNGQIWVQSSYDYHYHYAYRPRVLIYPSMSGWRLQVEGDTDSVQVARVQ